MILQLYALPIKVAFQLNFLVMKILILIYMIINRIRYICDGIYADVH